MKISIVTISFNQQQYLRACIDSILDQSDCAVEYIVVDPGSTDGSREIIESYGDRIVQVFEKDSGPADGLNRGFARATGDVYGFINSDDYLLPGALKTITEFFNKNGNDVFVTGQGYTENEHAERTPIHPNKLTSSNMLHRSGVVFQQSTFFPAVLFKKAGGFNDQNSTCWDYELFLRFLLQGATHQVIDEELAVFRFYQGSISGSGRLEERYYQELDQLFEESLGRRRNSIDKLLTQYQRIQRELGRRLFGRV